MFKLKTGDKVRLVLHGLNSYYGGRDFIIHDEKRGKYQLKEGTPEYFFNVTHFEYIQPQTLTIEMASDPDIIVNCRTEEDAKYFCKWLDLHKKRWITGYTYLNQTNWDEYEEDTCYSVSQGLYGNANLTCWKKQDDNEKDIIAIIRFASSMIQNDSMWAKSKAYKSLSKTTKTSDENRVLTDVVESTAYKIIYDNIPVFNKNNVIIGTLPQEILHIYPKITSVEFNDKITTVTIGGRQIKVTCQDCDTYIAV